MGFSRYAFIILLSFYLFPGHVLHGADGWDRGIPVSSGKYIDRYPDIYQDKDRTLVTWTSYRNNLPSIYFNYKDPSWHKPQLVGRINRNKIIYPAITFKNGKVLIVASDENNRLQIYSKNIDSKAAFKKMALVPDEKFNILPNVHNFNHNVFLFYQEYINKKKFRINYIRDIKAFPSSYKPKSLITMQGKEYGSFFPVIQFHNNKSYALWTGRLGEGNSRNDAIYLKYSSGNYDEWSPDFLLSEGDKNAKSPDFTIYNNKLYVIYYITEPASYIVLKILDQENPGKVLYSDRLKFDFSDYYKLSVRHFKDKFHIFWYSYIGKNAQVLKIESHDFKIWSSPEQITSQGKNKLAGLLSINNLAFIYERSIGKKTSIYYKERDKSCSPPKLYSTSHKTNIWSFNNSVIFKWKEPADNSGIKGYAYLLDQEALTEPDIENLPSNFN